MIVELEVFFTIRSCACEMERMHISTINMKMRKQYKKLIQFNTIFVVSFIP